MQKGTWSLKQITNLGVAIVCINNVIGSSDFSNGMCYDFRTGVVKCIYMVLMKIITMTR